MGHFDVALRVGASKAVMLPLKSDAYFEYSRIAGCLGKLPVKLQPGNSIAFSILVLMVNIIIIIVFYMSMYTQLSGMINYGCQKCGPLLRTGHLQTRNMGPKMGPHV